MLFFAQIEKNDADRKSTVIVIACNVNVFRFDNKSPIHKQRVEKLILRRAAAVINTLNKTFAG